MQVTMLKNMSGGIEKQFFPAEFHPNLTGKSRKTACAASPRLVDGRAAHHAETARDQQRVPPLLDAFDALLVGADALSKPRD